MYSHLLHPEKEEVGFSDKSAFENRIHITFFTFKFVTKTPLTEFKKKIFSVRLNFYPTVRRRGGMYVYAFP